MTVVAVVVVSAGVVPIGSVMDVMWPKSSTTAVRVVPSAYFNARLAAVALAPLRTTATAEALLRRPRTTYAQLQQALDLPPLEAATAAVVEAEVRYTAMRGMPARHAYQREPTGSAAVSAGCPSCSGGSRGGSCSV